VHGIFKAIRRLAALLRPSQARDDGRGPIRADVVAAAGGDTEAAVGQTVEIRLDSPAGADKVSSLKATITGAALEGTYRVRDTRGAAGGGPGSSGTKSIYLKARARGSATVVVEYRRGEGRYIREYAVEVD